MLFTVPYADGKHGSLENQGCTQLFGNYFYLKQENEMSQCKTKADLHREWARVLDMCEGTEVAPTSCWKNNGLLAVGFTPNLECSPDTYSFAFAIFEDKPVFIGDELWNVPNNFKFTAARLEGHGDKRCIWNGGIAGEIGGYLKDLSWNPPKPKTVMVELLVEDAKDLTRWLSCHSYVRVADACKKALGAIK
jgi:hypothetical protein